MAIGMLPREAAIALDGRVLLFAAGLVAIVSVVFGSIPAWQSRVPEPLSIACGRPLDDCLAGHETDAKRSAGSAGGARHDSCRVGLDAGLQFLVRLSRVDPGFSPAGVLTFRITMPQASPSGEATAQFHSQILDELRRVAPVGHRRRRGQPATARLAVRNLRPGRGHPAGHRSRANAHIQSVVGDYFAAIGIPVKAGRVLNDADRSSNQRVAVVNETFVRRFIGDGPAVGRRVVLGIGDDGKGGVIPAGKWWASSAT